MADGLLRGGAPMTRESGLQHVGRWRKSPVKLLFFPRTSHAIIDKKILTLLKLALYG